jgi:hypothetical protein
MAWVLLNAATAGTADVKKPPAEAAPHRLTSPGGDYEVEFRTLEHKQFSGAERNKDSDHIDHVKYQLVFFAKGSNREMASLVFHDVYGLDQNPHPATAEELFKQWVWSPAEDFVILIPEGWPSAPGTEAVDAVALNKKLKWKKGKVQLDHGVWVDSMRVIGDLHADCQFEVVMFDGLSGKTTTLKAGKSPAGYQIRAHAHRALLIEKVLDNCRSEEQQKTFKPECFMLSLDTLKDKPATCPAPASLRLDALPQQRFAGGGERH